MNLKELVGALGDTEKVDQILDQRLRVPAAIENMDKPWIATRNCPAGTGTAAGLSLSAGGSGRGEDRSAGTSPGQRSSLGRQRVPGAPHRSRPVGRHDPAAKTVSGPKRSISACVTEVWPNAELKQRAVDLAAELATQPRIAMATML